MTDERHLEEQLRRFEHQPDPRVKTTVMTEFEAASGKSPGPWWRRGVPMHAAAAVLFALTAASFYAGARLGGEPAARALAPTEAATEFWAVATSDATR